MGFTDGVTEAVAVGTSDAVGNADGAVVTVTEAEIVGTTIGVALGVEVPGVEPRSSNARLAKKPPIPITATRTNPPPTISGHELPPRGSRIGTVDTGGGRGATAGTAAG